MAAVRRSALKGKIRLTFVPILFYYAALRLRQGGAIELAGSGAGSLLFRSINSKWARLGPPANFQQMQAGRGGEARARGDASNRRSHRLLTPPITGGYQAVDRLIKVQPAGGRMPVKKPANDRDGRHWRARAPGAAAAA
jgi:hypothetical protein